MAPMRVLWLLQLGQSRRQGWPPNHAPEGMPSKISQQWKPGRAWLLLARIALANSLHFAPAYTKRFRRLVNQYVVKLQMGSYNMFSVLYSCFIFFIRICRQSSVSIFMYVCVKICMEQRQDYFLCKLN
ncbi:hypothetical protein BS78_02G268800 [Paspalum vaginatum]|nr:hypothetical protein BS78_02G268800 [Paspalum vaginatum]